MVALSLVECLAAKNSQDNETVSLDNSIQSDIVLEEIPEYERKDFNVGRFLGAGQFCGVFEASYSQRPSKRKLRSKEEESISQSVETLAIKMVQGLSRDNEQLDEAYSDLVNETAILSSLSHKNIIRLYGQGKRYSDQAVKNQYFIIIERLSCTLDQKISAWNNEEKTYNKEFRSSIEQKNRFRDRLQAAASIASAISYLHSHNIVYRDLKPSNIGFDSDGEVKLFDLGLARILEHGIPINDYCGSPRYMAPEVFQKHNYEYSVDVYSFSILLWEICSMKKPFGDTSVKSLRKKIIEGVRPKLPSNWNASLRSLIALCWDVNPNNRPKMIAVHKSLGYEIINFDSWRPVQPISFMYSVKRKISF